MSYERYTSDKYGFTMLVPEGTSFEEREFGEGWGGLYGEADGVEFYGVAKLGTHADPEEIEEFGCEITGVPSEHWESLDEGEDEDGWTWYRIAEAHDEESDDYVLAGYGTGPKGSYLLFLKTTGEDADEHESDYEAWAESVEVF